MQHGPFVLHGPDPSMDRNTIIGLALCAAIVIGYSIWSAPSKEEVARYERQQDSLLQVENKKKEEQARQIKADTLGASNALPDSGLAATAVIADSTLSDSARTARLDSVARTSKLARFGIFAPATSGTDQVITLQNEKLQVSIGTKGARPHEIRLKDYHTYHGAPLLLSEPDSARFEYRFFLGTLEVSTKDLYFTPEKVDSQSVSMKAVTNDPRKFLRVTYRFDSAAWFLRSELELVGLKNEVDPRNLLLEWQVLGRSNEKHLPTEQEKCTVFYKYTTDDVQKLSAAGEDSVQFEAKANWVAFKQDFFTLAMVHDKGFHNNGSSASIASVPTDTAHTKRYSAKLYFDQTPADLVKLDMRVFMGPNQFNVLRQTEVADFHRIIDLGWGIFGWINRYIVIPIFQFLDGKMGYGLIILVLTIAIKIILLPIAYKNQKSSARMRALRPETEAINKKYPDPEDMMKRQQANMELYRKAGVNPMSGCIPMLLQLPILYAMFSFFPSSIELRQQSFLWADDLSSYDSILTLPFTIPLGYGSHVSLFCLLMSASTIVYSLITMKQVPTQQGMPSMKLMMWIFPFMMLFFMNSRPAGLSYYYLLANLISILQMTVLSRFFIDEDKLRAELVSNMSKPRKKSKWQQRIEEIQKQQQAQARKRR